MELPELSHEAEEDMDDVEMNETNLTDKDETDEETNNEGETTPEAKRQRMLMLNTLKQLSIVKNSKDVKKIVERSGQTKKLKGEELKPMRRPDTNHSGRQDLSDIYIRHRESLPWPRLSA
jgi:hypothetical protein